MFRRDDKRAGRRERRSSTTRTTEQRTSPHEVGDRLTRLLLVALAGGALLVSPASAIADGVTERASIDSAGAQANAESRHPVVSADGRYVAFSSHASNLVTGDTNGWQDVFVHDRVSGQTERISVDSSGLQGNLPSERAEISPDGRYVAFESSATNLVAGDTNDEVDVFVHDRVSGQTERVSVDSSGTQGNDLSHPAGFSADGRYVAFSSWASNLVAGDTNNSADAFVRDRLSGQTERVSIDSGAQPGNTFATAISADGRYVGMYSFAGDLVAEDTNGAADVFVRDRLSGQTERISLDSSGTQGNGESVFPSISADGRYVAYTSIASNLVAGDTNDAADAFVHDRLSGQTERISRDLSGTQGNGGSFAPALSADGRYVAYYSEASNLVASDTNDVLDVFVHDRVSGQTERVSVDSSATQANGDSFNPVISADGRYVAYYSEASNLVAGDTNSAPDVFVRDRAATSTPAEDVEEIFDDVEAFELPDGLNMALKAKLQKVLDAIAAGDIAGACTELGSFINQIKAQQGKKLTAAQAAQLIEAANDLRAKIGCA